MATAAILIAQASPFSREVYHAGSIIASAVGFPSIPSVETNTGHGRVLVTVAAEGNIVQAQRCVRRGASTIYGCAYVAKESGENGVCQTSQNFLRNLTDVRFQSIQKVKKFD